jgi:hypothetical protein
LKSNTAAFGSVSKRPDQRFVISVAGVLLGG